MDLLSRTRWVKRCILTGLFGLICHATALAAPPTIRITAVADAGGWIAGTLHTDDPTLAFVNPLDSLKFPRPTRLTAYLSWRRGPW